VSTDYELVQLANGEKTLFSASYGEKMHPGLGPQAEAELLYVRQLGIRERLAAAREEFVIWDVGLGAAANAIATLRSTREITGRLRLVSFDNTDEPLQFALNHAAALGYPVGYENQLADLRQQKRVTFQNGKLTVNWEFHHVDFPAWLERRPPAWREHHSPHQHTVPEAGAPHAIFYDAFSPAKNPAMWTLPVFQNVFRALDPARPCALTTYSRSTLLRTTLLLAGFFVGVGHAAGMKEETTLAANHGELVTEPLGRRWLERALRSDSAEPLREPLYSRAALSATTAQYLREHPQFSR
jgi:tRNA U34 5-methylaminomethyl-2-thiouridine-forming methyltransferase MnmC